MQLLTEYCRNQGVDDAGINLILREFPDTEFITPDSVRLADCMGGTARLKFTNEQDDLDKIQDVVNRYDKAYADWGFHIDQFRYQRLLTICREYYEHLTGTSGD